MCGIVGILGFTSVNQAIYDALTVLQHRGQDAAGIMTCENNHLFLHKANGLVRDVFNVDHMMRLKGNMGIGHVRYPTSGTANHNEAQPFYVNSPYGITLAHNGNLTNAAELATILIQKNKRHLNTQSDSEILLNVFANELDKVSNQNVLTPDIVFQAIEQIYNLCQGGFAAVSMIMNFGLVAFRDPYGIRPAIYGIKETALGQEYMIASESVALDALGFKPIADIQPGEAICITKDGALYKKQCVTKVKKTPCIFEYVYFARPDSILDGISVYKARLKMGEMLAKNILAEWSDHDIDVVIPVPDTSLTAATPLAFELNVKLREGFIKNRYIGRTFIMPGQKERQKSVRQKLNAISLEFKNKNVLLVDDSIVRGTTSREIIQMARDAGAKKVYFASAAPPVRYPNVYGLDIPSADELIANNKTIDEVCKFIGADKLFYQSLPDLISAVSRRNKKIQEFETSVFNNKYITGNIDKKYLVNLAKKRNDRIKEAQIYDV